MAAGYDGSIRIKALLDHNQFDHGIQSMGSSIQTISGELMKLAEAAGAAFGVAALINFGKESVSLASDVQEVQNVIDVTFGNGAAQIEEFAKSAAESFGLSELSAKQYTGTMGAMLKSFGLSAQEAQELSIELAGLAGDIASFYNFDVDEAFEKIRSGISGETEPLKQLGINMSVANLEAYALSKGITKSYDSMSQAEQVLLRFSYLLSVTADAQGDFSRTSDSLANQLRILQLNFSQLEIAVGNAIIPIVQTVLPAINTLIAALVELANVFAQVTSLLFGKSQIGSIGQVQEQEAIASSGLAAADATDKLAGATSGVGKASKQAAKDMNGILASFDELNILADKTSGSVGGAAGSVGGAGGLGGVESSGEIWGDMSLNPDLSAEVYALIQKLKDMIPLISGIGAGFLAWKLSKALIPELGALRHLLGSLMVGVGITLLVDSIKDILFGAGLTWGNILEGAAGGAVAGGGLGLMLAKQLGLTWARGMLGGAVIGLGISLLIESVADILTRGLNIGNSILGAIGGVIAGAAAGFLYMGGFGGAILGAAIGLGVSLLVESIADIAVKGLNLVNGVAGLIGGALAGAGIGFYLGGPAGAAIGAVIGVGLTLVLEGIVSQISSGLNLASMIETVIGTALAGAGIGFAIGGVGGAVAGFVIGILAGAAIEITGITLAGKMAYAATEDFRTMTRVIEECEDSANRSSAAMENLGRNIGNLNTSLAAVGAAQSLVDEIYAINNNANASAYELEMMRTKVELLNSMGLDGLHLTIDETTGRIVETKEATDQLIASLQKEAETAALQELLVQAYKDRYVAVSDAEQAVKKIDVAEQALKNTEEQLTNTPWWDLDKHAALTAQQEKQKEALEAATDARDKAINAYDELSGAIDTYSVSLTNSAEPEANVGVQLESRMDSVRQTVEGVAADMPGYGKNIGEGLENGMSDGIKEEKTKGIFSRVGNWFKELLGISSPSKVFAEFGGFLMEGLHIGLQEKLEPINQFFTDLWEAVKQAASGAWDGISGVWSVVSGWFGENVISPVKEFFTGLWETVKQAASGAWDGISGVWSVVSGWFKETVLEPLSQFFTEKWDAIKQKVSDVWEDIKSVWERASNWFEEHVTGPLGDAFDAVAGTIKNAVNNVVGKVEGMINAVIKGVNWLISQLNEIHFDVPDWVPGMGGRSFGINIQRVSEVHLPRLANGAVIPPNQQFAAILGDQRSGVNIEAPLSTIEQALQAVLNRNGGLGSGGNLTVIMEIDGREFGRASYKYGSAERQRIGVRLTEVRT